MDLLVPVLFGPLERGDKPSIFRDIVGRDPDRLAEFFDERAIGLLDADAVAGRTGIPAGTAIDVGDDRVRRRTHDVKARRDRRACVLCNVLPALGRAKRGFCPSTSSGHPSVSTVRLASPSTLSLSNGSRGALIVEQA